jgi:hypothetical protein
VTQQAAHRDELTDVIRGVIDCEDDLSQYGLSGSGRSSREQIAARIRNQPLEGAAILLELRDTGVPRSAGGRRR